MFCKLVLISFGLFVLSSCASVENAVRHTTSNESLPVSLAVMVSDCLISIGVPQDIVLGRGEPLTKVIIDNTDSMSGNKSVINVVRNQKTKKYNDQIEYCEFEVNYFYGSRLSQKSGFLSEIQSQVSLLPIKEVKYTHYSGKNKIVKLDTTIDTKNSSKDLKVYLVKHNGRPILTGDSSIKEWLWPFGWTTYNVRIPQFARQYNSGLKRVQIRNVIKKNLVKFKNCANKESIDEFKGFKEIRSLAMWSIDAEGKTKDISVTINPDSAVKIKSCVKKSIQNLRFDKPSGGVDVKVAYPFVFIFNEKDSRK